MGHFASTPYLIGVVISGPPFDGAKCEARSAIRYSKRRMCSRVTRSAVSTRFQRLIELVSRNTRIPRSAQRTLSSEGF